jgi:hypothetical protein
MILALIAVLPIVLERVHNEQFNRSKRIEATYQQALSLAHQVAAVQSDVFVSARAVLTALAAAHVVDINAPESCSRTLKDMAQPERGLRSVSVANLRGSIVCSSNPAAGNSR